MNVLTRDKYDILISLIHHELTATQNALLADAHPLAVAIIARIRVDIEMLSSYIDDEVKP